MLERKMYLVKIRYPHIALHNWITWSDSHLAVVMVTAEKDWEEEAKKKVRTALPSQDSAITKILWGQHKTKEYYDIRLKELKDNGGGVFPIGPINFL